MGQRSMILSYHKIYLVQLLYQVHPATLATPVSLVGSPGGRYHSKNEIHYCKTPQLRDREFYNFVEKLVFAAVGAIFSIARAARFMTS